MKKFFLILALFLLGLLLAGWATPLLTQVLLGLEALLAVGGFLILLGWQPYRSALLSPAENASSQLAVYRRLPFWKYLVCLFIVQGSFFVLSLVFFDMVEFLNQTHPRLQPMEMGSFLQIAWKHKFLVEIAPWLLYAVAGVGMAYFIQHRGAPPVLADMILPDCRRHPKLFIHNYLLVVTETIRYGSLMILMVLAILWQCQALNGFFQLEPLAKTPFRTIFIIGLLFLAFQKSRKKAIDFLQSKNVPLGGMMVFFVLTSAFLIFWLHSTGAWFSLGIEATDPQQVMKSILAGSFTPEDQENRWCLLMWGWWSLWLPWMASLVARLSMGRPLWQPLLISLVFPAIFFTLLFDLPLEQWREFSALLKEPLAATSVTLFLLLFMLGFFGHVRSNKDLARGGLIHFGKWRGASLAKSLATLLVAVACYFLGLFTWGWLAVQLMTAFAGIFAVTLVVGFIWTLLSSTTHLSGVAKYKVLGLP